jgi:hypothetical protein
MSNLEAWIRQQYPIIGIDHHGCYVGKRRFKQQLIAKYPTSKPSKQQICQPVS